MTLNDPNQCYAIIWSGISKKTVQDSYNAMLIGTSTCTPILIPYSIVPFRMTSSDLEWLSEIFNDTKYRAVSLQQLSFLYGRARIKLNLKVLQFLSRCCSRICKSNLFTCLSIIRPERCLRHGGPWASAKHYIQKVWTERSSSAVASVIPVRPHSDCQYQQSTVYAEHSVVRCATRFGPGAGTTRHVYGGPWRVNHRLQCSTSLLC